MPIVSILILTYNSRQYIKTLLESLESVCGNRLTNGFIEVIVVDNDSTDNTSDEVKKYVSANTHFYRNDKNTGFAGGINFAASKAKGDLLMVVNPDARVKDLDIEKIIDAFEKDQEMVIAGLTLIDENGKRERNAGKFYNPISFLLYCIGLDEKAGLRFSPNKKMKVDYVSGGFVVFRKDFFVKVKGYDEDYFMYVEDMDISYRARQMGMHTYFLPYATAIHKGQGSSSHEFAIVNIYKGLQIFFKKHSSFLMQIYISSLLSLKAATIIFLGALFGKKDIASVYSKALKTIK